MGTIRMHPDGAILMKCFPSGCRDLSSCKIPNPSPHFSAIPPQIWGEGKRRREEGGGKERRKEEKRRKDKEKWLKHTKMYIKQEQRDANFLARALSRARLVMVYTLMSNSAFQNRSFHILLKFVGSFGQNLYFRL